MHDRTQELLRPGRVADLAQVELDAAAELRDRFTYELLADIRIRVFQSNQDDGETGKSPNDVTLGVQYLLDKSQKKVFQFLLMSIVLRNSLDIYKLITITTMLFVWMLHWLAIKRLKGLIGEESKSLVNHARLLALFCLLIAFDGFVTYVFVLQFLRFGNKMNDIYVIAGFEVTKMLCLTHVDLVRAAPLQSNLKLF